MFLYPTVASSCVVCPPALRCVAVTSVYIHPFIHGSFQLSLVCADGRTVCDVWLNKLATMNYSVLFVETMTCGFQKAF